MIRKLLARAVARSFHHAMDLSSGFPTRCSLTINGVDMRYAAALMGLLVVGNCMGAQPSLLPDRVDKVNKMRIAAGDYPALVIAVVDGNRSAVYSYGKLDNGKAPDSDTVFEIGSITKTFTATLLAQSVLDGKLKLDAPVASLLPGFTIPSRNGKTITLEDLAMQHSGLPGMPTNFRPRNPNDPYAEYGGAQLKAFLAGYTLPRDPGSEYEYSNLGVGLLGFALAQHAGMTYDALLHAQIFDPLGMHNTDIGLPDAMRAHLAKGHDESGKQVANWNIDALAGAGGIRSSTADMLLYLKANMGLSDSSLYPAMQLAQKPRADTSAPELRIGLVWMTQHDATRDVIWHNGGTGGYRSFLGFTADRKHGVVVLTNIATDPDDLGFAVLESGAELPAAHKAIPISDAALDEFVGSYQVEPDFILKVTRSGHQLYMQASAQDAFRLFASANDEFFATLGDVSFSFRRDGSHKVTSLVLHQFSEHAHTSRGDHVAPRVAATANANTAISLDAATLANYVGQYPLAPGVAFTISVDNGQLYAQLTGQSPLPMFASAKDKFFLKVVDAQVDFERDTKGNVIALVLHQNGANQRAVRTPK
jgi:D-alanyl-D-alanine-carboxypeptidase/D-alanyl-D-alanine-endopeptidase